MDLITKLNHLGEEVLERYPCINYGGCAVYAAMIVAALKRHNIDAKGIVASYGAGSPGWMSSDVATIDKAREKIKKNDIHEWQANGISFAHVGVEFKIGRLKKHYDTSGVRRAGKLLDKMPIYEGRLEYTEVRALAASKKGWNSSFDRKDIPALRKLVNARLKVDKTTA